MQKAPRPVGHAAVHDHVARAGGDRPLRFEDVASRPHCRQCDGAGRVWVVCPDAGAVELPCGCRQRSGEALAHVDAGLVATAFLACGALFLLI